MNAFEDILDTEYVMTWMGLILVDTTLMDDATLAQAFRQLIAHLQTHIDQAEKEASVGLRRS